MNQYRTAEDFLASQGDIDLVDELDASAAPTTDASWSDIQQARAEYLKEWEEDMRYAQELANEGM